MRPSIWMSPVEVSVPLITMSALMMEGAAIWRARLGAGIEGMTGINGWGAGAASLGLLENMAACLDEVVGVLHDVVVPDFVMHMRSGGATGRADMDDAGAFADLGTDMDIDL